MGSSRSPANRQDFNAITVLMRTARRPFPDVDVHTDTEMHHMRTLTLLAGLALLLAGCGGGSSVRPYSGGGQVVELPPMCPEGQVGTPPNCTTPLPPMCPEGQVGTPPNCTTPQVILKQCPDGTRVDPRDECPAKDCGGGLTVPVGISCEAQRCPSGALISPGQACPVQTELPPLFRGPKPRGALFFNAPEPIDEPWLDTRTVPTVRVAIHDDGVDFTHPVFEGRIGEDGSFAYWHASQRDARFDLDLSFIACSFGELGDPCHVWIVDGEDSPEVLQRHLRAATAYVRKLRGREADRQDDIFWIYDQRADRWYELPPYEQRSNPFANTASHGTAVASVVLREAPDATIVPFSLNFGYKDNKFRSWDAFHWPDILLDTEIPYIYSWSDAEEKRAVAERDERYAQIQRDGWASVDVFNASYGYSDIAGGYYFSLDDSYDYWRERSFIADMKEIFPKWWRAYTQADVHPDDRAIIVYANGNGRWIEGTDEETFNPLARLAAIFPELRGHTIAAAALNARGDRMADWADVCGAVPLDWNTARDGRHWCITAPGTDIPVAKPGGTTDHDDTASGSSFAAPYVSGVLAAMMEKFRGQVGNTDIVKRLMDTADRSGIFGNAEWFGAGVVNKGVALSPVGVAKVEGHALARTRLTLPAAYGDAARRLDGAEIASFDDSGFPFWQPLHTLVSGAQRDASVVVPNFGAEAPDAVCAPILPLAPGAVCARSAQPLRLLAAPGRIGAAYSFGNGLSVSTLTHAGDGRMDGQASGAFSLGFGASVFAVNVRRDYEFGEHWRLSAQATIAVDAPGARTRMIDATPALLSTWEAALVRRTETTEGAHRLKLSIDQPLRAESGRAVLTVPSGRTRTGETTYTRHAFDLAPSGRELRLSASYERSLFDGEAIVHTALATAPGHARGKPELTVGAAWRWMF